MKSFNNKLNGIRLFSEAQISERIFMFQKFAEGLAAESVTVEDLQGWLFKNVQIFKVGTYNGQSYTTGDLDEMVTNFSTLKSGDIFDPVFKKNHSENVEDQIGWINAVRRDGDFLVADIHVTDWQAYDKISSGTWRYVSSEIYPPALAKEEFDLDGYVLRAVAVVSVPKVKGLNGLILNSEILENPKEEEIIVNRDQIIALLSKVGVNFSEQELEKMSDEDLAKKLDETVQKFAETPPAKTDPESKGGKPDTDPIKFGEKTPAGMIVMNAEEFMAVSTKISGMADQIKTFSETVENLKKNSRKTGIEARVDKLLRDGKITPAEKTDILSFAEKLDDEALELYLGQQEKRPVVIKFGEMGDQDDQGEDAEVDAALAELNKTRTF